MRLVLAKVDLHHGQKLGHCLQAGDPAVYIFFEAERTGLRKAVVLDALTMALFRRVFP